MIGAISCISPCHVLSRVSYLQTDPFTSSKCPVCIYGCNVQSKTESFDIEGKVVVHGISVEENYLISILAREVCLVDRETGMYRRYPNRPYGYHGHGHEGLIHRVSMIHNATQQHFLAVEELPDHPLVTMTNDIKRCLLWTPELHQYFIEGLRPPISLVDDPLAGLQPALTRPRSEPDSYSLEKSKEKLVDTVKERVVDQNIRNFSKSIAIKAASFRGLTLSIEELVEKIEK